MDKYILVMWYVDVRTSLVVVWTALMLLILGDYALPGFSSKREVRTPSEYIAATWATTLGKIMWIVFIILSLLVLFTPTAETMSFYIKSVLANPEVMK